MEGNMKPGHRDDRYATKRPTYVNLDIGEFPEGEFIADVKCDGKWVRVDIEGTTATVWNRHGILVETFEIPNEIHGHCILHGEMLTGTTRAKADPRYGKIVVFDCERVKGGDVLDEKLHRRRLWAFRTLQQMGSDRFEFVRWMHSPLLLWEYVVANGLEGIVIKDPSAPFGDPWYRMKQIVEVDFICTGVSHNRRTGHVSLEASTLRNGALVHVGNVPVYGLEQGTIAAHAGEYVGRVFKARGFEVTPKGGLRSPKFLEWHADKVPGECR
jgi:ATP-dependent DNA ligase